MIFCQFCIAVFKLLVPISLGLLIDWFADPEAMELEFVSPDVDGYIYAVIFGLASLVNALFMAPTMHDQMVYGHGFAVQACSLMYKKILSHGSHSLTLYFIIFRHSLLE